MFVFSLLKKNTIKIAIPLVLPSVDGVLPTLSASNTLTLSNAPVIALTILAGPASLLAAALAEGNTKTRVVSAVIAGLIALVAVTLAALIGTRLASVLNLKILRVFAALTLISIALGIAGLPVPEKLPLAILTLGLLISIF